MFGKAEDRTLLDQATHKIYFDINVHATKRLKDGQMVFMDRQKHKQKIVNEIHEQIAKSKHLPKSTGLLRVKRNYHDVIAFDIESSELPVSVNHCYKAPAENAALEEPNLESNMNETALPLPHPIINISDGPEYQLSETAVAHSPLHIGRHELDRKSTSAPNLILV